MRVSRAPAKPLEINHWRLLRHDAVGVLYGL
jgi:hypothetical protein